MLIIFAGLPGAGKTTLSTELARRAGATYLRIDSIEQAMRKSSLGIHPAEDAGYGVGYALAEDNLRLGRTVVADSVNPLELTRNDWRQAAERAGRKAIDIEVICSDPLEHRRRVEIRGSDIVGPTPPSWQDVVDREYHAWTRAPIVIDTASKSVEQSVDELWSRVSGLLPQGAH